MLLLKKYIFPIAAKKMNLVLLIKWQKYELEDFLLPPKGGLDWRLPEGMDIGDYIKASDIDWQNIVIKSNDSTFVRKKNLVVHSHIDLYYLVKERYFVTPEHPEGTFRYVWNLLFIPAP